MCVRSHRVVCFLQLRLHPQFFFLPFFPNFFFVVVAVISPHDELLKSTPIRVG